MNPKKIIGATVGTPMNPDKFAGGNTSIDVTAAVGQTIIVKETDENGKPTKWESVGYQPRTHWVETGTVLPETTAEVNPDEQLAMFMPNAPLYEGCEYTVKINGFECVRTAKSVSLGGETGVYLGNGSFMGGEEYSEDPFIIIYASVPADDEGNMVQILGALCFSDDKITPATTITLSIEGAIDFAQIPEMYIPKTINNTIIFHADIIGLDTGVGFPINTNYDQSDITAAVDSGKDVVIMLKCRTNNQGVRPFRLTKKSLHGDDTYRFSYTENAWIEGVYGTCQHWVLEKTPSSSEFILRKVKVKNELTEADKTEIAQKAAGLVDTALLNIIGSGVTE